MDFHLNKMCGLQTAINEVTLRVHELSGIPPDSIMLPFNLYFRLIFSLELHKEKSFDGVLGYFNALRVDIIWKNCNYFIVYCSDVADVSLINVIHPK